MNDAMLAGLQQLAGLGNSATIGPGDTPGICILFVLTDGVPSAGETNLRQIERNVENANQRDRCAVVTLGKCNKNLRLLDQCVLERNSEGFAAEDSTIVWVSVEVSFLIITCYLYDIVQ